MTKKITGPLFAFAVFILTGCGNSKHFVSKDSAGQIREILLAGPFTSVAIIEKGNNQEIDNTISQEVLNEMNNQIATAIPDSIQVQRLKADSALESDILSQSHKIINAIRQKISVKRVEIPGRLIEIMDSVHQDFCFIILEGGLTRTKANYIKQLYYTRPAVSMISLGYLDYIPYRQNSGVIGFIIDRKRKQLAYFKKIVWPDRDPTEKIVIKGQLHDLMMSYFQLAR